MVMRRKNRPSIVTDRSWPQRVSPPATDLATGRCLRVARRLRPHVLGTRSSSGFSSMLPATGGSLRAENASAGLLSAAEEEPCGREEPDRPDGQGSNLGAELVHALAHFGGAVAEHGRDRSNRRQHVEEGVVEEMSGLGAADQADNAGHDAAQQARPE